MPQANDVQVIAECYAAGYLEYKTLIMKEKYFNIHFKSHNIANAIKCDKLVELVTTDIEEGRHRTGYDIEIEKGTPMVIVSLLVEDLIDKMRTKCNVRVNGEPPFNNIFFTSNSTADKMEIVSVDYCVEYIEEDLI